MDRRGFLDSGDRVVDEANIIEHVTADFPPTFIADGNFGTFPDQAEDLADELDALGVVNRLDVPSPSTARLGHGYMALGDSPFVEAYNARKIAFLRSVVG